MSDKRKRPTSPTANLNDPPPLPTTSRQLRPRSLLRARSRSSNSEFGVSRGEPGGRASVGVGVSSESGSASGAGEGERGSSSGSVAEDGEETVSISLATHNAQQIKSQVDDILDNIRKGKRRRLDTPPTATTSTSITDRGHSHPPIAFLTPPATSGQTSTRSSSVDINIISDPNSKHSTPSRSQSIRPTQTLPKPKPPPPVPDPLSSYTCPICFSPPTNATLTPCGHVCCGACLFTAVRATMQRGAAMPPGPVDDERGDLPRCPVCRAQIPGWDGKGGGVIGLKPRVMFVV